jgi:multiple sugar transport system substrate-binding protein
MKNELQVALISGPAYNPLYEKLAEFSELSGIKVKVSFSGAHPTLNHYLASLPEVHYDLVSTHSKYAPSQLNFLAPLNGLLDSDVLKDFVPMVLELSKIDGLLYGLPRNIDVRLLHYRSDLISTPPTTWDELFELAKQLNSPPNLYGFLYPGRDSGMFGTFYELAEMAGAQLFPKNLIPQIENEAGRWALGLLRKFYAEGIVPKHLLSWHYDEVSETFCNGHAAMIGDFPGYYSLYKNSINSKIYDKFKLTPYPVGPANKLLVYGGGHTFALTKKGVENPAALKLLLFLTAFDQQLLEAKNGCVPVRRSVMQKMKCEADAENRERLGMLEKIISEHILIPPKISVYPKIEEILWRTVQTAIVGKMPIDNALTHIREQIEHILRPQNRFKKYPKPSNVATLETGLSY